MSHRMAMLAVAAIALGCEATTQSGVTVTPPFRLTVQLVELTQNPTPVGLPTSFAVDAPGLPRPGGRVDVTWRALDGEATTEPRTGSGFLEVAASAANVIVTLTAPRRASGEVLVLSGAMTEGAVHGTFSDRLFSARAGRFDGQMQDR